MYETFHKPLSAYELEELIHGPQMAFDDQTYLYFIASNEVERTRIPLFLDWIRENEVTEHVFVFYARSTSNKSEGSAFPQSDRARLESAGLRCSLPADGGP